MSLEQKEQHADRDSAEGLFLGHHGLFSRRLPVLVCLSMLSLVVLIGAYLLKLEEDLINKIAVNSAERSSIALHEFRELYTSEVVEAAQAAGMIVTHDYEGQDGAIPLPATLSIMIGSRMSKFADSDTRLYSDFPFRGRRGDAHLEDEFQVMALKRLRQDPTRPVTMVMDRDGVRFLRYATADVMREGCVECHNTHPDSPKTDWKVGDVRGVLEVALPLLPEGQNTQTTFRRVLWAFVAVIFVGFAALVLLAVRIRDKSLVNASLALKMIDANRTLELEILERERSESERKKLEHQVIYAQKLESIGLLAGGIAHDFNNLLMGVLGNANLLKGSFPEGSENGKSLDAIEYAVFRGRDLSGQLLAYAGKGQFSKEIVDLNQFVKDGSRILDVVHSTSSILRYDFTENALHIDVDSAQLQQVIMNLVTNAVDSLEDGVGEVMVRTDLVDVSRSYLDSCLCGNSLPEGPYVLLEVRDTGRGIPPESYDKIFDPFFSTKSESRGLGLAALQGIVRSHGGALKLESTVGEGTCFQVLFTPAVWDSSQVDSGSPAVVARAEPTSIETVLVVEDSPEILETTADLLSSAGFAVITAANGAKALEIGENRKDEIDFLVVDMRMPGVGGAEVCRRFRQWLPTVSIVLVSGHSAEHQVMELCLDSRTAFLQKPYRLENLLEVISELRAV
jgi:signal transduction histidine kinase